MQSARNVSSSSWIRVVPVVAAVATGLGLTLGSVHAQGAPDRGGPEQGALAALQRYMETWNTRMPEVWATSLHFPHVRPSAGRFRLTRSPAEYAAGVDFERTLATGWHRSQWDAFRVLHVSPAKVHVAGRYTRYDVDGAALFTALVTYVVTRQDGRWGTQLRFGAGRAGLEPDARDVRVEAARTAVERYVDALNHPTDPEAWAETMHYPHVRHADDQLRLWESAPGLLAGTEPGRLRTWYRTRLVDFEAVQVGERAVNASVRVGLENPDGDTVLQRDAVFLITAREGVWKVQARSAIMP